MDFSGCYPKRSWCSRCEVHFALDQNHFCDPEKQRQYDESNKATKATLLAAIIKAYPYRAGGYLKEATYWKIVDQKLAQAMRLVNQK